MSKTDFSHKHHLLCIYRQWVERAEYPKRHICREEKVGREKTKIELLIILLRSIPVCVHQPVWNNRGLIPSSDYGRATLELNREQSIYYIQSCFIISSEAKKKKKVVRQLIGLIMQQDKYKEPVIQDPPCTIVQVHTLRFHSAFLYSVYALNHIIWMFYNGSMYLKFLIVFWA